MRRYFATAALLAFNAGMLTICVFLWGARIQLLLNDSVTDSPVEVLRGPVTIDGVPGYCSPIDGVNNACLFRPTESPRG